MTPTPRQDRTGITDGVQYIYGWYAHAPAVERLIDRTVLEVLMCGRDPIPASGVLHPLHPFVVPGSEWVLLYAGKHEGAGNPTGARVHNQVGAGVVVRSLGGDTLPTLLNLTFGGSIDATLGTGNNVADLVRSSLQNKTSQRVNDLGLNLSWVQAATLGGDGCGGNCPGLDPACCPASEERVLVRAGPNAPVGARPLFNAEF